MLYREITDTEDAAQRIGSIRAYLKPISAVTGLNDLYKLYADPLTGRKWKETDEETIPDHDHRG